MKIQTMFMDQKSLPHSLSKFQRPFFAETDKMILNFVWGHKRVSVLVIYRYITSILKCSHLSTDNFRATVGQGLVWLCRCLWLEASHRPQSNCPPGCVSSGSSTGGGPASKLTPVFARVWSLADHWAEGLSSLVLGQRSPSALATGTSKKMKVKA